MIDSDELIIKRAIGFIYMEMQSNGTIKTFYRNGTVALFNRTGFVRYVIPPKSIYVWILDRKTNNDRSQSIVFSNGTTRVFRPPDSIDTSEFEIATGYETVDLFLNGSSTIYYRNGSVQSLDKFGTRTWIVPPKSFYLLSSR